MLSVMIKNFPGTAVIENNNQSPQVFVWTAPVAQILSKVAKCQEALDTIH